jgi:predicted anti-sigma-YlaC factor YlaD
MNHDPKTPLDAQEREWIKQEKAKEAERGSHASGAGADEQLQPYRIIARALSQPMDRNLPDNFAEQVAQRVRRRSAIDMRLEWLLSCTLLGVLLAMFAGTAIYFSSAWDRFIQIVSSTRVLSNPWMITLAVYLVIFAAVNALASARWHRR